VTGWLAVATAIVVADGRLPPAAAAASPALQKQGVERVIPPVPRDGFIHDGGPILTAADIARMNQQIAAVQASGRGDIGVAIINDLEGHPPFEAGTAIYRAWKIGSVDTVGSARRNLGALLLIVPKELAPDRKGECWITTGIGAEGVITDAMAGRICRDSIIPHLRDKDYPGAVFAGIGALTELLTKAVAPYPSEASPLVSGEPVESGASRRGSRFPVGRGLLIGFGGIGMAGLGVLGWRRRKRRKPRICPHGHGPMRLLDEKTDDEQLRPGQVMEEELKSVDYDVWRCETCREVITLRYKRWLTSYSKCESCGFWTVKSKTRTLVAATRSSGGLQEVTQTCQYCRWTKKTRQATPRITSSSSSSGGSSGGSRSFGGSGRSSGGGGGSSY
jgi:uncharacterized protein